MNADKIPAIDFIAEDKFICSKTIYCSGLILVILKILVQTEFLVGFAELVVFLLCVFCAVFDC